MHLLVVLFALRTTLSRGAGVLPKLSHAPLMLVNVVSTESTMLYDHLAAPERKATQSGYLYVLPVGVLSYRTVP